MWWSPSLGRDNGAPVWTGFVTGDYAREMLALGEDAALQKGWKHCGQEIGEPTLQFVKARWVNWPDDPFALGGYSVCLPGHYAAREKLAQATPPLYWAGEATRAASLDGDGAWRLLHRSARRKRNRGELLENERHSYRPGAGALDGRPGIHQGALPRAGGGSGGDGRGPDLPARVYYPAVFPGPARSGWIRLGGAASWRVSDPIFLPSSPAVAWRHHHRQPFRARQSWQLLGHGDHS